MGQWLGDEPFCTHRTRSQGGQPQLPTEFDWDGALSDLAMIRGRMRGDDDAVAIVREGRAELERRTLPHDMA